MPRPRKSIPHNSPAYRLRKLRADKDLRTFAAPLGVDYATIGKAERGERRISDDVFAGLKKMFPDLTEEWLFEGKGPGPNLLGPPAGKKAIALPRPIGRVAAGDAIEWFAGVNPEEVEEPLEIDPNEPIIHEFTTFPQWGATSGPIYCLQVVGQSMQMRYPERSWIFCRKPIAPERVRSGWDVVFENDRHEYTFKRLIRAGQLPDVMVAQPLNPMLEPAILKVDQWRIWGVVIGCLSFPSSEGRI